MPAHLTTEFVKAQLIPVFEECFNQTSGIFLDKDTSLINTISTLSAEQVSRSIVQGGTCIAGHLEHVRFYLRVMNDYMDGKVLGKLDWSQSWLCKGVNEEQWHTLKENLSADYQALLAKFKSYQDLSDEKHLGGIIAVTVHTAFHLGAIRQMMLVVTK